MEHISSNPDPCFYSQIGFNSKFSAITSVNDNETLTVLPELLHLPAQCSHIPKDEQGIPPRAGKQREQKNEASKQTNNPAITRVLPLIL